MTDFLRLTLRSLLSYREGLLPPDEHDLIRERIQQAAAAQHLDLRIKKTLESENPSTSGMLPNDCQHINTAFSPTAIAEYIDNSLGCEELGRFERSCLDSDEMLAEVAECLRMLSAMRYERDLKTCLSVAEARVIRDKLSQKAIESPAEKYNRSSTIIRTELPASTASTSLPLSEEKWIVKRGQHKSRPLSVEKIRQQAETGELAETDLLWRYGGDVWLSAGELAEQVNLVFGFRYRPSPKRAFHGIERRRLTLGPIALALLLLCCVSISFRLFTSSTKPVTAELTYPDGSPLPLSELLVRFHPLSRPLRAKTTPKPHEIIIDPGAISFQVPPAVTARITPNRPSHRITLHQVTGEPLPSTVIATAYSEPQRTPLLVSAADHESIISLTVELVAEQFRGSE